MSATRRAVLKSFALYAAFLGLYLAFLSRDHYFDSIDYARIVETGDRLFWQKHILQHAGMRWFHGVGRSLGAEWSGLVSNQIWNAACGAACPVVAFTWLRRLVTRENVALGGAVLLGTMSAVARHAVEGEVHIAPFLALLLAFAATAGDTHERLRCFLAGLACAAAVLLHQSYVMVVPAVLAYAWARGRCWRALGAQIAAMTLPVVLVYAAVFWRTELPRDRLWAWLTHEAGFQALVPGSVALALESFVHAISPSESLTSVWRAEKLVPVGAVIALAALGARRRDHESRSVLVGSATLVAFYLPAITWHQPAYQYFVPLCLPVAVAAMLGADSASSRAGAPGVLGIGLAAYGALSVLFTLVPARTNTDSLERATFVANHADSRSLVVSVGTGRSTNDGIYLDYFFDHIPSKSLWWAKCCSGKPSELPALLDEIDAVIPTGARVLVTGQLVEPGLRFEGFAGREFDVGGDEVRRALDQRYVLRPVATFEGAGYRETLFELSARPTPPSGACGPAPHYRARGDRCLPSCGAQMAAHSLRQTECCTGGCSAGATVSLGPWATWDCEYCCGSPDGGSQLCRID